MPKIAWVDVDGTLLDDGRLNEALVEHLRTGGYDQIWLFTQRGCSATAVMIATGVDASDEDASGARAYSLTGVVDALSAARVSIRGVSTSYDPLMEKEDSTFSSAVGEGGVVSPPGSFVPGEYFEGVVKPFESHWIDFTFVRGTSGVIDTAKKSAAEKIAEVEGNPESKPDLHRLVDDKNRQAACLLSQHEREFGRGGFEVVFFDDRKENFEHMRAGIAASRAPASGGAAAASSAAAAARAPAKYPVRLPARSAIRMVLAERGKTAEQYKKDYENQVKDARLPKWFMDEASTEGSFASKVLKQIHRMSDNRVQGVAVVLNNLPEPASGSSREAQLKESFRSGDLKQAFQVQLGWARYFCCCFARTEYSNPLEPEVREASEGDPLVPK